MSVFDLRAKIYTSEGFLTDDGRFHTLNEALTKLKKIIRERCNIEKELRLIGAEGGPSPCYRASVCAYLEAFFNSARYPSRTVIDYSDYKGARRSCDPHYNEDSYEIGTAYEKRLGFAFAAAPNGMRLGMLGRSKMTCHFYQGADRVEFSYEPFEGGRTSLYIEIEKTEGILPTKINASAFLPSLLSVFLNGEKLPIDRDPNGAANVTCLTERMEQIIFTRINEEFILPSNLSFSSSTIRRQIELLIKLGYDIHQEGNDYYLPPFVCEQDAAIVFDCIDRSDLSNEKKEELKEKFSAAAGCNRFASDELEECNPPAPQQGEWGAAAYPLLILETLRRASAPLPITSGKKENLQELITKLYSTPDEPKTIGRKAIAANIDALIAVGYPIQKTSAGVYLETEGATLNEENLVLLEQCICQNTSNTFKKMRLPAKLRDKFSVQ